MSAGIESVEEIQRVRLGTVRRQRPGQSNHVIVLHRLAGRRAEQIHGVASAHVKQPRQQLVTQFLGVGRIVKPAEFDAALAHPFRQFAGGFVAVEADETRDRLARLDVEAVFRIIRPVVGFAAELQRQANVFVPDGSPQPVRIIAKAEVLVAVRAAIDRPLFLRLPVLPFRRKHRPVGGNQLDLHRHWLGDVGQLDRHNRLALRDVFQILRFRRLRAGRDSRRGRDRLPGIVQMQPHELTQRLSLRRTRKQRRRFDVADGHRLRRKRDRVDNDKNKNGKCLFHGFPIGCSEMTARP